MGFGLVRYSARASITLNQLAGSGCDLNQRAREGIRRDGDKREGRRWRRSSISVGQSVSR